MSDTLTASERSERMRLIKSKDTKPELRVRSLCRELGHVGYRLHRKDLAGKPDIAFVGHKRAIFVHGCFWHGHACNGVSRKPKSNLGYWLPKIERNIERDGLNIKNLQSGGWRVLVVWECETKHPEALKARLAEFLA
jgi:DNA mismatch endonuclease (patch repair protein)